MTVMRNVVFCASALALLASCNEIIGIHEGKDPGSAVDCDTVADCPAPLVPECSTLTGCEGNTCQYTNELDGKPLPLEKQTVGDCTQVVCNANGGTRLQAFDADAEDDGNPCTQDSCQGGISIHTPQQQVDCYDLPDGTPGPAGTKGIGNCKTGIQLCDADFQPIGGCEGAVFPEPETCNAPGDEDCDNETNEEGAGCYCTPSTQDTCYGGNAANAGVGICQLGTCQCNDTGTACESVCKDWVPPQAEDCSTPEDEDCDGEDVDPEDGCVCVANEIQGCYVCDATGKGYAQVPSVIDDCQIPGDDDCDGTAVDSCTGTLGWVKASVQTGSYPSYTLPTGIAVDDAGNVTIVGVMYNPSGNQTLDLGGGVLANPASSPTAYNVFLASYSPAGAHLWSQLLPCIASNAQSYEYYRPRVTVAGTNVVVGFYVAGANCDFGSGAVEYTNGAVVVRLDGATGAYESKTVLSPNTQAFVYAMDGATDGSVVLGGYVNTTPWLAKLDSMNAPVWFKPFPLSSYSYGYEENAIRGVHIFPDGAVGIAGSAEHSTIDLGAGPQGVANNYQNQYFAVFEPDGALRWSDVLTMNGCCTNHWPFAVGSSPAGDLRVVGRSYGAMSFCGPTCQAETATEVEPNELQAQATPLGGGQRAFAGSLSSGSDVDYFAFTVPANTDLELWTSDPNSLDGCGANTNTYLVLYDSAGSQLAADDNDGTNNCSLVSGLYGDPVSSLPAGTYFAKVTSVLGAIPAYRLNISVNGVGPTLDQIPSGFYEAAFDVTTGAPSLFASLTAYNPNYPPNSASFDELGHALVVEGTNAYGVQKYNAQGASLWTHPIPFYFQNGVPPVVAAGPDGSAYFAGQIYPQQTIDGVQVGTPNNYEIVWGKLAQ